MRAAAASVIAAGVASACCLGPVVMVLLGVGAFGASLAALEPYRPVLLAITLALLGVAFYSAYRPAGSAGVCTPASRRRARLSVWLAALLVLALVTFPYYVEFLF